MLQIARKRVPNAVFHQSPIEEFRVNEAGFDLITCIGTLHHMPDLDRVAHALFSLMKPDGVLVVLEPNAQWWYKTCPFARLVTRLIYAPLRIKNYKRIKRLRAPWENIPESPHHKDIVFEELDKHLSAAGFRLEYVAYKNGLMRVFEGMLFRESFVDRVLYRLVRFLDSHMFDRLIGQRSASIIARFRSAVWCVSSS